MYIDEFINKIKLGESVKLDSQCNYFGLKVNNSATAVYCVGDSISRADYVGFINHVHNCYYVDDKQIYNEVFKFDDFKDGWSFDETGCGYMNNIVNGKECGSFKSDLVLKRVVLNRYYKSIGDELQKIIGDVDLSNVKVDCKGSDWFHSNASCIRIAEGDYINRNIKSVEGWNGIGIDWHELAFGISEDDDFIKEYAKLKLEKMTGEQLEDYKDGYIRGCAEHAVFHSLLTKPYEKDNLYYWLCLDIKRELKDVDKATIKMIDGATYKLKNLIYDVSETSYIGGDCGKHYQYCPFVNIADITVYGERVFDRSKSLKRLQSKELLGALNDMASKGGCELRKPLFGDLVFSDGQFGIVLTDNMGFYEDGKIAKLEEEYVVCNSSYSGLNAMKHKLTNDYEKLKGDKCNGYER